MWIHLDTIKPIITTRIPDVEMWIHLDTIKPIITTRIPDETPARKRRISPSSLNSIPFFILPGAGFPEY